MEPKQNKHVSSLSWNLMNKYSTIQCFSTHFVDPGDVGADPGEDGRLLGVVAAHAWTEAHHTMDLPGAIRALAVQGATRVSLKGYKGKLCDTREKQNTTGKLTLIDLYFNGAI